MNPKQLRQILKEELSPIIKTQQEHSALLNEHSGILKEHSHILDEHSGILQEHSNILKEHSDKLDASGKRSEPQDYVRKELEQEFNIITADVITLDMIRPDNGDPIWWDFDVVYCPRFQGVVTIQTHPRIATRYQFPRERQPIGRSV